MKNSVATGSWVIVRWNDAPNEIGLVVAQDREWRSFEIFFPHRKSLKLDSAVDFKQVVKVLGVIKAPKA